MHVISCTAAVGNDGAEDLTIEVDGDFWDMYDTAGGRLACGGWHGTWVDVMTTAPGIDRDLVDDVINEVVDRS